MATTTRMRSTLAEAEAVVPAPARRVYDVLADYRAHHPHILPKPEFESLRVQHGGRGEGTRIRVAMRVMGQRRELVMDVTEPEPGRVLQERDVDAGTLTRFVLDPVEGGAGTRVRIVTEWTHAPTARARLQAWITAHVARRLYERELANLAAYLRDSKEAAPHAA